MVRKGRFGPYAQHGSRVANLPRDMAMEDMTLEDAVALLAERGKALKPKPGQKKKAAVKPGVKPAAKPAAKKAPPKAAAKRKPAAAARKAG